MLHRGLSREGRWLAAVLAAGHGAALSHLCAAALWCLREIRTDFVTVVAPKHRVPKGPLRVHECRNLDPRDVTSCSARRWTSSSDIRLNVEVDGSQHRRRRTRRDDERRDAKLEAGGYTVLRFTAFEVQERPDQVRATLESARRRLGG